MTTLFLRLMGPVEASDEGRFLQTHWLISESDGNVRSSGEADLRGLSELVDPGADWLKSSANLVVFVPTHLVTNVNCDVPGRNPAQIRRALPFVVEEFIASDIESMHVAAGKIAPATQVRSLVVERDLIAGWLEALAEVGLHPGYLLPDAETLHNSPNETSVLFNEGEALVRSHDNVASVDVENLEFVLPQFLGDDDEEMELNVINGALDPLLVAQLPGACKVKPTYFDEEQGLLGHLATQWRDSSRGASERINLLQGEYQARQDSGADASHGKTLLKLLAIWFFVALLAQGTKGFYAERQADTLRSEVESLYKDIYPQDRRIPPDIRRQMQAYMGRGSGGDNVFMQLVGRLSDELDKSGRVRGFNFQSTRKELSVELILDGFETLNALKERLAKDGLMVEISSADNQDDGVHARLRLRIQ